MGAGRAGRDVGSYLHTLVNRRRSASDSSLLLRLRLPHAHQSESGIYRRFLSIRQYPVAHGRESDIVHSSEFRCAHGLAVREVRE
jgi:hypothetical protein